MSPGLLLWKAQFHDPDEASDVLSKATNARLRVEPSKLYAYALDLELASDSAASVMNGRRSGGQLLIENSPRYLGIRCLWQGGGGGIVRSRTVDLFNSGTGMIFDSARIKGHLSEPGSSDTLILIPFDRLMESSRHLVDRPLQDNWAPTRLFTPEDAVGNGLHGLVRAAAATVELARTQQRTAGYSLRTIREAIQMFLIEQAGVFGDPGDEDALPLPSVAQVQQALEIIDAMAEPLTVLQLAERLNVSVRSLQIAFRKHFGALPHAAIKRARLKQARRLIESGTVTTVRDVCLRLGFTNAARFAVEYRSAFGESPAATLDRTLKG